EPEAVAVDSKKNPFEIAAGIWFHRLLQIIMPERSPNSVGRPQRRRSPFGLGGPPLTRRIDSMDRRPPLDRRAFLGTLALGASALAAPGAFAEELTRTPKQTEG